MSQPDDKMMGDKAIYLLPIHVRQPPEGETGFGRLWHDVVARWALVVCTGLLGAVAGVGLALIIPREYRSEILLSVINDDQDTIGSAIGALSNLSSFIGLRPDGANLRNSAIATLRSRSLAREFISEHDLLPVIFADRWDTVSGTWKTGRFSRPPTLADAVKHFDENIRFVSEDRKTGLVTLAVVWRDRKKTAEWANDLVQRVNANLREQAIAEARASLDYLERDLEGTRLLPLQEAAFRMTEQQLKRIMLAKIRTDYALRIIDPATVPEEHEYVSPRPLLLSAGFGAAGLLGGAFLAAALATRRRFFTASQANSVA